MIDGNDGYFALIGGAITAYVRYSDFDIDAYHIRVSSPIREREDIRVDLYHIGYIGDVYKWHEIPAFLSGFCAAKGHDLKFTITDRDTGDGIPSGIIYIERDDGGMA